MLPAAAAVAAERPTWPLITTLVLVHLGTNLSVYQMPFDGTVAPDLGGYWAVPALFLLLLFIAFRRQAESILGFTREPRLSHAGAIPVASASRPRVDLNADSMQK
jgi:hypothetical protein